MAMQHLSEADTRAVGAAVAAAEANTAGEIVTVVTDRSDGYTDVALAWSALVAFTAIAVLTFCPDFYLGLVDRRARQVERRVDARAGSSGWRCSSASSSSPACG